MENKRKQVKFFCAEEEYTIMQKNAQKRSMTLSAYLRAVGLQGKVICYNYDAIRKHTDEVLRVRDKLYPFVAMLTATGQALPEDVQRIVFLLESLNESEGKLLDDNFKERERMRKLIKNELKK